MKFRIVGAGGAEGKTTKLNIERPYEFILQVGNKDYRFSFDKDGNITIALINGVDAKITTRNCYPAVKITQKYNSYRF